MHLVLSCEVVGAYPWTGSQSSSAREPTLQAMNEIEKKLMIYSPPVPADLLLIILLISLVPLLSLACKNTH
jgi:hypothetical protein